MAEQPFQNGVNGYQNRDLKTGRFVRGNKASPGRPRGVFSPTQYLRAAVEERPEIMRRLLLLAESEDEHVAYKALSYIANRLDGMPRQSVEQEHKGSFDISLTWGDGSMAG